MMKREKNYQGTPFFFKGDGRAGILLLHGWTSPPDEFLPLAKYLNSLGYSVMAPLLAGHGTRPEDLKGVTWRDWLRDGRKALEEVKKHADKIFVGGISIGGDLAFLLSADKSVAGIISLGAPIRVPFHRTAKAVLYLLGLTKTYRRKYFPPWVQAKRGNRPAYPYYPMESAKEAIRLAEAVRKFLPRVTKPVLIMQSDADHMSSKKSPRIIHRRVKSKIKEIYWVRDAYHVFVNDRKVWKKITEFMLQVIS